MTETLEWWPDYGGGPVWKASGRGGQQVDSGALGLPLDLAARLAAWNQHYAEDKLPVHDEGDPEWLRQGIRLLAEVRLGRLTQRACPSSGAQKYLYSTAARRAHSAGQRVYLRGPRARAAV